MKTDYFSLGKWIAAPNQPRGDYSANGQRPAPCFRKEFTVSEFLRAEVVLCGLGYHELYLNGRRVSDRVLAPAPTNYDRRARFLRYDISSVLRPGINVIGVILGNGWYNPSTDEVWNFIMASWRDCPKFALELSVDGKLLLGSDESWQTSSDGPIRFNALRNGETYDARHELCGWCEPEFNAADWCAPDRIASPGGVITEELQTPCRVWKTKKASPMGQFDLYDAGENLAGWARITVHGTAGSEVTIRYAERLTPEGDLSTTFQDSYVKSGEFQTDHYILRGDGSDEIWEPRFTYHGFRYLKVTTAGAAEIKLVEARFVGNDFATTGTILTGDPTLDELQAMTCRSYRANFVGIPTDCPHREKNGWTGDAQLACETGLFNYAAAADYADWIESLVDAQRPNGELPCIVPTSGWGFNWGNGPAWDSALIVIPYNVYLHTGDDTMIRKHYGAMRRYLDFLATMATDHIVSFGLGDWCHWDESRIAPVPLTSTAFYYSDVRMVARFAQLLNKKSEAAELETLADQIRLAFNRRFYRGDGIYGDGGLTATGCALYYDLPETEERAATERHLIVLAEAAPGKVDFGILGAKYVPRMLAEAGRPELAMAYFTRREFPGWAHWIELGLTTLGEHWDGRASQNHIMYGDIGAWFYRYLAGFRHSWERPGKRHLTIIPCPLTPECTADYLGYRVHWVKKSGEFRLNLTIPEGGAATLRLPDGAQYELGPGEYHKNARL